MRKTRLQMATGVNYTLFRRYVDLLESRGIVRMVPDTKGGEAVELTPKGAEALDFLLRGMERITGRSDARTGS